MAMNDDDTSMGFCSVEEMGVDEHFTEICTREMDLSLGFSDVEDDDEYNHHHNHNHNGDGYDDQGATEFVFTCDVMSPGTPTLTSPPKSTQLKRSKKKSRLFQDVAPKTPHRTTANTNTNISEPSFFLSSQQKHATPSRFNKENILVESTSTHAMLFDDEEDSFDLQKTPTFTSPTRTTLIKRPYSQADPFRDDGDEAYYQQYSKQEQQQNQMHDTSSVELQYRNDEKGKNKNVLVRMGNVIRTPTFSSPIRCTKPLVGGSNRVSLGHLPYGQRATFDDNDLFLDDLKTPPTLVLRPQFERDRPAQTGAEDEIEFQVPTFSSPLRSVNRSQQTDDGQDESSQLLHQRPQVSPSSLGTTQQQTLAGIDTSSRFRQLSESLFHFVKEDSDLNHTTQEGAEGAEGAEKRRDEDGYESPTEREEPLPKTPRSVGSRTPGRDFVSLQDEIKRFRSVNVHPSSIPVPPPSSFQVPQEISSEQHESYFCS